MSNRTLFRLTEVSDEQLGAILDLILAAFGENDAGQLALLGGDLSLARPFHAATIRAALLEGRIYAIESEGKIVSFSLWFRRPSVLFGSEAQRKLGYEDLYASFPARLQHWWSVEYPEQMGDYENTIISQQEWDRMWYCNLIVTDPKYQNRGHATFLMNEFFAQTPGEMFGLSCCSDANAEKYTAMGFKERGRILFRSLVNEFPCIWMTRDEV